MRKPASLDVDGSERESLEVLVRRHKSGQALAQRARLVPSRAEADSTNTGAARCLGVRRPSVMTWPGARGGVDDAEAGRLSTLTLDTRPQGATPWSTRTVAEPFGMSRTMVSRIRRAFGSRIYAALVYDLIGRHADGLPGPNR